MLFIVNMRECKSRGIQSKGKSSALSMASRVNEVIREERVGAWEKEMTKKEGAKRGGQKKK